MIKNVACGISGGIDSAISAYFLKKNNFNVIGVFMTNWDLKDETTACSLDQDREDAKYVCDNLNIPFHDISFVKDYWNNVFEKTIESYKMGCTPNPDIMCNKFIKFDKFAKYCLSNLKVDAFATGHYARSVLNTHSNTLYNADIPLLRRPLDKVKDQTFWLCQVDPHYLAKCIFPLSDILKMDVKKMGRDIGLLKTTLRKESTGMCFIGKRKFKQFIDAYIEPAKGLYIDLETGNVLGEHRGVHFFTLGQRTGLSLSDTATYVAHMDPATQHISVVHHGNHPALFTRSITTGPPHWLGPSPLQGHCPRGTRLRIQCQNKYCSVPCTVVPRGGGGLTITLEPWMRCLAPGQYAVLYSEDDCVCLGSAVIETYLSGYEEGLRDPIPWQSSDYENQYIVGVPGRRAGCVGV